jgi:hypothetical protein
MDCINSK